MSKVNKFLVVIIFVLSLFVIGVGGYIIYDKIMNDGMNENNNNDNSILNDFNGDNGQNDDIGTNNDSMQETLLMKEDAKVILKDLEEKYFDYDNFLGVYCGNTNSDDYISFGSYETNNFRDYWASTQFESISELKEYYRTIMVEELMPDYIDNDESYIEQDGKLYCQLSHKGGGFTRDYDVESTYDIRSIEVDTIVSDVVFWGYDMSVELSEMKATITIVKNDDGKWLVSNYEINY